MAVISQRDFAKMFGFEMPSGGRIPQHLVTSEKVILMNLIRCFGYKKVLELGVSEGYTTKFLLGECSSIEKYVGVDVPWGFKTVLPIQQTEVAKVSGGIAMDDGRFRMLLPQNGTQELVDDPAKLGETDFDVCFVDADHSYDGVRRDTLLAWKVVRRGGVIVWHDYNNNLLRPNDVNRFIDEQNIGRGDRIFLVEGTVTCFSFNVKG